MLLQKHTRLLLLILSGIAGMGCLRAQEHQVIKIQKESAFIKAEFDPANYKAIAVDRFGNLYEEAVKSYKVTYSDGKTVYEAPVKGNTFPEKTIRFFEKQKFATKVCIVDIVAEDKDGHLEKLPDLCDIMLFPTCKNVKKTKS